MYRIEMYLEIGLESLQSTENQYGYVLVCGEDTTSGFGERTGTKNQVTLSAMIEALKRINQSCEIHIHTSNDYVVGMMNNCIDNWICNGYTTSKGKEIANVDEWQQVTRLTRLHLVKMEKGIHEYTEWLKYEMRRRK